MAAPKKHEGDLGSSIDREEMQRALERVLSSKYFANAPMKQRFLRLICEFHLNDHGRELNEYLIGREVFGRDDSYNPSTDPIVRVGAHGIREKLDLYYQNEGSGDEIRIEIPTGAYEPVFTRKDGPKKVELETSSNFNHADRAAIPVFPAADPALIGSKPERKKTWQWISVLAIAALTTAVIVLIYINRGLRGRVETVFAESSKARAACGYAWEPFLKNSEPTLLILSNPFVYRSANGADPEALIRKGIKLPPEQSALLTSMAGIRLPMKPDRPVELVPALNMYTGVGEAIGIYGLSYMLRQVGEATILKQSRSVSADDLKSYDVILLGSVYSNQWSKPLSVTENFLYTNRTTIENRDPRQGEKREYTPEFNQQTGELIEDYALISVTPGVSPEKTVMVLSGIYSEGTEAAAEFVTNSNHLNELNRKLIEIGGDKTPPTYYQALLKVGVENSFPTRIELLTIRKLQTTFR